MCIAVSSNIGYNNVIYEMNCWSPPEVLWASLWWAMVPAWELKVCVSQPALKMLCHLNGQWYVSHHWYTWPHRCIISHCLDILNTDFNIQAQEYWVTFRFEYQYGKAALSCLKDLCSAAIASSGSNFYITVTGTPCSHWFDCEGIAFVDMVSVEHTMWLCTKPLIPFQFP